MPRNSFSIEIDDRELNRQIRKALQRNPQETVKAVKECALDLSGESAKRAPIESGDLRNNCHADLNGVEIFTNQRSTGAPTTGNAKAEATVGYSLPYALRQHEELGYSHNKTDGYRRPDGTTVNMVAGGEAKFLEKPFEEKKEKYIERMGQIVERSLR